jgi:hypothetical protein
MGPDEESAYIVAAPYPAGDFPTPIGNVGTVSFWSSAKTDSGFIALAIQLIGGSYATAALASDALFAAGYWTSYTAVDQLAAQLTTSLSAYNSASVNDWVKITSTEYNSIFNNISGATKKGNTDAQVANRNASAGFTEVQFSSPSDVNVPVTINTGEYPIAFVSETWNATANVRFGYTTAFHTGAPTYGNAVSILPVQRNYYVRKAPSGVESAPATQTLYPALKIDGNIFNGVLGTRGWYTNDGGTTWASFTSEMAKFQMIVTSTKSW